MSEVLLAVFPDEDGGPFVSSLVSLYVMTSDVWDLFVCTHKCHQTGPKDRLLHCLSVTHKCQLYMHVHSDRAACEEKAMPVLPKIIHFLFRFMLHNHIGSIAFIY